MQRTLTQVKQTYREFPFQFWILVVAGFIGTIGSTILFPFFTLYVTQRFAVGMTQAGALLGVFSAFGLLGSIAGGALCDRFGRRGILLFGLVVGALSSLAMGFVGDLDLFFPLAALSGLLGSISDPARQAMVADMLPEEKRSEGFGILRVSANLAWVLGPTLGGLLASRSFLYIFLVNAFISGITAVIVYKFVPETKPAAPAGKPEQGLFQTLGGYRLVLLDKPYVGFLVASILMMLVYLQMYSTLSVYLRDVHGIPSQGYGFLMSLDAGIVVLFQFWVTRRVKSYAPMLMMAVGTGFYLVGFTLYGLVGTYLLFAFATILITIGEMIVVPVGQVLVARFAPEDMRGRYMAVYGLSWSFPSTIGPWAAGIVMDNYNPNWVWYGGGILCAISIAGFYALHLRTRARFAAEEQPAAAVT